MEALREKSFMLAPLRAAVSASEILVIVDGLLIYFFLLNVFAFGFVSMIWRLHWKTTVRIRNEGSAGVPILSDNGYSYIDISIMTDTIEGNRGSWEKEQKNQFHNRQRIYGLPCADRLIVLAYCNLK